MPTKSFLDNRIQPLFNGQQSVNLPPREGIRLSDVLMKGLATEYNAQAGIAEKLKQMQSYAPKLQQQQQPIPTEVPFQPVAQIGQSTEPKIVAPTQEALEKMSTGGTPLKETKTGTKQEKPKNEFIMYASEELMKGNEDLEKWGFSKSEISDYIGSMTQQAENVLQKQLAQIRQQTASMGLDTGWAISSYKDAVASISGQLNTQIYDFTLKAKQAAMENKLNYLSALINAGIAGAEEEYKSTQLQLLKATDAAEWLKSADAYAENNPEVADYVEKLKNDVAMGVISTDEATKLLGKYY